MTIDRIFDALASRPRREILAYLSKNPLTTTELVGALRDEHAGGVAAPVGARERGPGPQQRDGQRVLYELVPDSLVNTLTGFAFEVCPVAGPLKRESRALAKRRKAKA